MAQPFNYNTMMVHSINHFRPIGVAVINENNKIINSSTTVYDDTMPKVIRNVKPGIYKMNFDLIDSNEEYVYHIYDDFNTTNNALYVFSDINVDINSTLGRRKLMLYNTNCTEYGSSIDRDGYSITLLNTINDYIDLIAINGESKIEGDTIPTLDHPVTIESRNDFYISSMYDYPSTQYDKINRGSNNNIYLSRPLRSLPNYSQDIFIIDGVNQIAYSCSNIGQSTFTGLEEIELVDTYSSEDYKVFYIKNKYARFNAIDSLNRGDSMNIMCTHFKPVIYEDLLEAEEDCICISDSASVCDSGFILKISSSKAKTVNELKKIFATRFNDNSQDSINVLYQLNNISYKIEPLNNYRLASYFGQTKITNNKKYKMSCFYRAFR